MDNLEDIHFTAIGSALGLQEPEAISQLDARDLEPPQKPVKYKRAGAGETKKKISRPLIRSIASFLVDQCFITCFFLFILSVFWGVLRFQFDIPLYQQWRWFEHQSHLWWLTGVLFLTLSFFYFLFFRQFKIPSPGTWILLDENQN